MDNPEKGATLGTQDEDNQQKVKHNTKCVDEHYLVKCNRAQLANGGIGPSTLNSQW